MHGAPTTARPKPRRLSPDAGGVDDRVARLVHQVAQLGHCRVQFVGTGRDTGQHVRCAQRQSHRVVGKWWTAPGISRSTP
jgi:hypothetical protein